jgi:hypothetical protein
MTELFSDYKASCGPNCYWEATEEAGVSWSISHGKDCTLSR